MLREVDSARAVIGDRLGLVTTNDDRDLPYRFISSSVAPGDSPASWPPGTHATDDGPCLRDGGLHEIDSRGYSFVGLIFRTETASGRVLLAGPVEGAIVR